MSTTDILTNLANELESARNSAARFSRSTDISADEHKDATVLAWSLDAQAKAVRAQIEARRADEAADPRATATRKASTSYPHDETLTDALLPITAQCPCNECIRLEWDSLDDTEQAAYGTFSVYRASERIERTS